MERLYLKRSGLLSKKIYVLVLILLVVLICLGVFTLTIIKSEQFSGKPGGVSESSENVRKLEAGIAMLDKQQYDEAARIFDDSIKADPDCYIAYYGKGRIDFRNSRFDSAKQYFEKSIKINPDFAPANMWLGKVYHFDKQYDKAVEYYKKAISLDPGYADAYCHLGYAQYYLKNEKAAIEYLDKAIELNPEHSIAYFGKARILNECEDYKEAEKCFSMAIQNDPKYAEAFQQRGILYAGELKYEKALSDLNSALALEPDNISSLHERGTLLFWTGKFKEAFDDFSRAQKLFSSPGVKKTDKDLTGYLNLEKGLCLFKMGNHSEGKELIKKGLKSIKPSDEDEDWDLMGYGYMAVGENSKAFSYFNKYEEGDLHHALYGRAVILLERGQRDKAIKDLMESVKVMPETWVKSDSAILLKEIDSR